MELSSKIKAMKFMKRKEDADERKKLEAQQKALAEQGHWRITSSVSAMPKYRIEYDSSLVGSSPYGSTAGQSRLSFKNFNPTTEKMNEDERRRIAKLKGGDGKSVSDVDMASAMENIKRPKGD